MYTKKKEAHVHARHARTLTSREHTQTRTIPADTPITNNAIAIAFVCQDCNESPKVKIAVLKSASLADCAASHAPIAL